MTDTEQEPLAYRVPAVARQLCLSPRKVWSMVESGELAVIRIGAAVRIPRTEVERILNSAKATTAA